MTALVFRLELIGGPFDGARGLAWRDDGELGDLPSQIHVGRCSSAQRCEVRACPGSGHAWYWTEFDEQLPSGELVPYVKASVEVVAWGRGVARYVCARDVDFASMVSADEALSPLVAAGAVKLTEVW